MTGAAHVLARMTHRYTAVYRELLLALAGTEVARAYYGHLGAIRGTGHANEGSVTAEGHLPQFFRRRPAIKTTVTARPGPVLTLSAPVTQGKRFRSGQHNIGKGDKS